MSTPLSQQSFSVEKPKTYDLILMSAVFFRRVVRRLLNRVFGDACRVIGASSVGSRFRRVIRCLFGGLVGGGPLGRFRFVFS